MSRTLIYTLIAIAVLFVILAAMLLGRDQEGLAVFTTELQQRDIQQKVSASGKIFPQTEVKISSDVSGEITELTVEEGDSVRAGQLLARIDADAFESQVARGRANLNAARANQSSAQAQISQLEASREQIRAQLINAQEIHTRNQQLAAEGVISQADLDASRAQLQSLEANLAAAEANIQSAQQQAQAAGYNVQSSQASLNELRTSLRRTTIYAPTDGVISLLNVEEGERVVGTIQMTGTEMMRIADLNAMEVRVEVSENDVTDVKLGDEVDIEVDAYRDHVFKGRVSQIASSSTNLASSQASAVLNSDQVTNFEVRITIDADSYRELITPQRPFVFRPGMSAGVDILTNRKDDVDALPIASVTTRQDEDAEVGDDDEMRVVVFVVEADTAREVRVETGIQDDEYIEILQGPPVGTTVVEGPYTALRRQLETGSQLTVKDKNTFYEEN